VPHDPTLVIFERKLLSDTYGSTAFPGIEGKLSICRFVIVCAIQSLQSPGFLRGVDVPRPLFEVAVDARASVTNEICSD
jgi:hypothetical protein